MLRDSFLNSHNTLNLGRTETKIGALEDLHVSYNLEHSHEIESQVAVLVPPFHICPLYYDDMHIEKLLISFEA